MAAKPRTPRYRADKYTERQFEPYVKAIGQLALAWNALHEFLGSTFQTLITEARDTEFQKEYQVRQAWNSLRADLAQRQMLRAVVANATENQKSKFPRLSEDLEWLIVKLNGLSNLRNDAIHSPLILITSKNSMLHFVSGLPDFVMPNFIGGNEKARRLQEKDLLAEFRRYHQLTLMYRDYVMKLNWALNGRHPWPDRPSLPPPRSKNVRPQTKPQGPKATRPSPLRSSRACIGRLSPGPNRRRNPMSMTARVPSLPAPDLPRYIDLATVLEILTVSRRTLRRMTTKGRFPAPIILGHRTRVWSLADIDAWRAKQETARLAEREPKSF
jgi:predicted DNA-binding transcriptional regulator AlpA